MRPFLLKRIRMQVWVNGQIEEIEAQSLDSYLNSKLLLGRRIAVELNGEIVPKSQFSSVVLVDGDVIEIVNAIGGG